MRFAVFFVYLSFLLLGGNNRMYGVAYHNSQGYTKVRLKFTNGERSTLAIADNDTDQDNEYLVDDDASEEDEHDIIAKKCKLLSYYYSLLFNPTTANALHNCIKAPPFFPGKESEIYLLQGVLRI